MPRVLLVEEGGRGGVADYTTALGGGLRAAGWDVEVATAWDHSQPPGLVRRRVYGYVRSPAPRRLRLTTPLNGALHAAAIVPLLALARRADVVHAQGDGEWPPLFAATLRVLRTTGRPLVWTPHNTFARGAEHARAWATMYAAAHRVVVHAQADLPAVPADARPRTSVIPMGELGAFAGLGDGAPRPSPAAARASLGLPADALVVLLFGQLRADKGLDQLLAAAREVPEVHVLVAGEDAGGLAAARSLLEDPALRGRVSLRAGWVDAADVPPLLAACDVVAAPYARASQSAALLLGLGAGRPAVVHPVGGLPEVVVPGVTGWVCERADPAALAVVLREVVATGREGLRAMGVAARRDAAARFAWDAIGRRTAALYAELLPGARRTDAGRVAGPPAS